jgi:hypothetical protein
MHGALGVAWAASQPGDVRAHRSGGESSPVTRAVANLQPGRGSRAKALPGRPKTDKLDSAWLAVITERGITWSVKS